MQSKRREDGTLIPTKTFKMPKTFKRIGASITNKEMRDAWNRAAIQAVLMSQETVEKKKKSLNGRVEQED